MMPEYKDFPFDEIADAVERLIADGASVYQKWSCDNCGTRQTMPEANKLFLFGICDRCGHKTNIQAKGCNYTVVMSSG
jgi:hypothetical protein